MMPTKDRKMTKEYDFRTMGNLDDFTTRLIWDRGTIVNDEDQFYANPDKVPPEFNPFKLSPSGLSITAMQTPPELAEYAIGQPYISGVLTTRDNGHSQLFGFWEASIKLPDAKGAWPAFWNLPSLDQWPSGIAVLSEIDILEAVGNVSQGIYKGTLHSNQTGKLVSSENNEIHTGADLTGEFHRYGLSWEPDFISWYFDGVEVSRRKTPADMQKEPRHFLLNLAVGGWGGTPDPDDYPASLEVEYVRIYENVKDPMEPKETPDAIENAARALELTADYLRGIRKLI